MKKILWITNVLLPDAATYLNKEKLVVGGWMVGLLESLKLEKNYRFGIASVYKGKELVSFEKNGISYFLLPISRKSTIYDKNLESYWQKVNSIFDPNITHIHGTEHAHGLAMVNACPKNKYVVSIQGLVSVYTRYYFAGLSNDEILLNSTFKDLIRGSLFKDRNDYKRRGVLEKEYIKKVGNVIGRTQWDKDHSYFINNKRKYFFCNESLRSVFYLERYKWNIEKIERHSIFLSQGGNPLKGAHIALKAVSLIIDEFPDIKIYIGGKNIVKNKSIKDRFKMGGYGKYISRLISKLKLTGYIFFTDFLNEEEMAKRFEKSHVFVCPSSIENSPNSLGEAQILGVPSIASYVGGTPNMITHGESGLLYRFEEFEMLASCLRKIFRDDHFAKKLSINGKKEGEHRHNREINKNSTLKIYNQILD